MSEMATTLVSKTDYGRNVGMALASPKASFEVEPSGCHASDRFDLNESLTFAPQLFACDELGIDEMAGFWLSIRAAQDGQTQTHY